MRDDLASASTLSAKLCHSLSSALPLPDPTKLTVWKLSYRLWNACVDFSNGTATSPRPEHADLRQIAAEYLLLADRPAGIPSPAFKSAYFFHKAGQIWHDLCRLDLAAACFERATDLTSSAQIDENSLTGGEEEMRLLLDVNLSRARTAWAAADRTLAFVNRGGGDPFALEGLKGRCLRFLAADRGGAPECGVCGNEGVAWGGESGEAEKELKGMMMNTEVLEGVCVSAAEAYLSAAGPEAAMGVLMGLVSRCRAGAGSALRVAKRAAEGGGAGRVKVVGELASDERVVALFHGAVVAKEREAMHTLLWYW